jgi:hypothetical protein
MNEMFDKEGRFVGKEKHVQVFDHSQELPAVEVWHGRAENIRRRLATDERDIHEIRMRA